MGFNDYNNWGNDDFNKFAKSTDEYKVSSRTLNKKTVVGTAVTIVALVILIVTILNSTRSYLTYKNYEKIQTGMTYNEVVQILDNHRGKLDTEAQYEDHKIAYYSWSNKSDSRGIVVGFYNGKVVAKSQYGLR